MLAIDGLSGLTCGWMIEKWIELLLENKPLHTHAQIWTENISMKLVCIFLLSIYTYAPLYNVFIKKLLQHKTEKLTL